jgi:P27 family predicted phage terminase small subunit
VLDPPDWLNERAKVHWRETVPDMAHVGVFTQLDTHSWALACAASAHFQACRELVDQDGLVIPSGLDGEGLRLHPALRMEEKWFTAYMSIAKEFGCTARARVGMHVSVQEPDGLDEFLQSGKNSKSRYFRNPAKDKGRFFQRGDHAN